MIPILKVLIIYDGMGILVLSISCFVIELFLYKSCKIHYITMDLAEKNKYIVDEFLFNPLAQQ